MRRYITLQETQPVRSRSAPGRQRWQIYFASA
jgi:hypothetical protein